MTDISAPRRPLVGPFIQTMVAAAFLFLMGVLFVGPFERIVVAVKNEGLWGAPLWLVAQLALTVIVAGVIWTSFWIWFKRGEKQVLEAIDERVQRGERKSKSAKTAASRTGEAVKPIQPEA